MANPAPQIDTRTAKKISEHLGIPEGVFLRALNTFSTIPGRVEYIDCGQNFPVVVDYAHTPDSLEQLYKTFPTLDKICVLGNTGGGRDTWMRPEMGRIADAYCDSVILTDEDPYDENPQKIHEAATNSGNVTTVGVTRPR